METLLEEAILYDIVCSEKTPGRGRCSCVCKPGVTDENIILDDTATRRYAYSGSRGAPAARVDVPQSGVAYQSGAYMGASEATEDCKRRACRD